MKNPEIRIHDFRTAYYLRKGIMEQEGKAHLRDRIKKLSNRSLMYGLTFFNRTN